MKKRREGTEAELWDAYMTLWAMEVARVAPTSEDELLIARTRYYETHERHHKSASVRAQSILKRFAKTVAHLAAA